MSERSIHPIIPTAMALALGATSTLLLQSQEARGYPAGASVSLGSNPVVSKGWSFSPGESSTLLSASADSDLVLTDVVMSTSSSSTDCWGFVSYEIAVAGETVATGSAGVSSYYLYYDRSHGRPAGSGSSTLQLRSGLRVPQGEDVVVTTNSHTMSSSCASSNVKGWMTVSGYHAQP